MIDLAMMKTHLRVAGTRDDAYLSLLMTAAIAELEKLTGLTYSASSPKTFDTALMLLVAHRYQNREPTSEVYRQPIPYGLDGLILNLRTGGF